MYTLYTFYSIRDTLTYLKNILSDSILNIGYHFFVECFIVDIIIMIMEKKMYSDTPAPPAPPPKSNQLGTCEALGFGVTGVTYFSINVQTVVLHIKYIIQYYTYTRL